MTREEANEILEDWNLCHYTPSREAAEAVISALDPLEIISALRPVSREQVEKVWPGCEACKDAGLAIGEVQFYGPFEGPIDVSGNMHYCPNCGRPITPVARDRQGKRLEALKDGPEQ
jgi:hypothetical protein